MVVSNLRPDWVLDSTRSVDVLDLQRLFELAGRSTPEQLNDVPGILVQRTNHGGGAPIIRGFMGQHVLLMLDGIRLNNGTYRYGPNQTLNTVSSLGLGRIEVLRGPGSILYGSDAIGGVVGLFARQPTINPAAKMAWGGDITARFGSADSSQVYDADLHGQYRRVAALVGGSFKQFNTLVGGRGIGEQPYTGYREGAYDAIVKVSLGGSWILKAATNGARQYQVPRTDQFRPDDFRFFSEQFRDLAYLALTGRHGRYLDGFTAILSYQNTHELRERFRLARDRIERENDDVQTFGFFAHGSTNLGRWSHLTWGADLYLDQVGSDASRESISTAEVTHMEGQSWRGRFVDGSRYLQGGVFVQDEIRPLSWLWIQAGARFAFAQADIPSDPLSATYSFVSPDPVTEHFEWPVFGLALTFVPWKPLRIIASVQQGFRAPNLDDYSHYGMEGSGYDLPSSGLNKAEQSTTFELGVKLGLERFTAWAFGHFSLLQNFVMRRYTGDLVDGEPAAIRVSSAGGYLAGLEAFLEWRLHRGFALRGWVSYSQGALEQSQDDPTLHPMSRVQPLQGSFALSWRHAPRYWAEVSLRWAARQDRLAPIDLNDKRICPDGPDRCTGTPGFAVVNLAGGARLTRHVMAVLRVENLSNEPYKLHGSGVYGPGLSAVAELKVSW